LARVADVATVSVNINGRSYRMACDEGQEPYLQSLAADVEAHVQQLKGSFGEIGDQRLTVMAAVMVADELAEARRRIKLLETDAATARASRSVAVEELEGAQDAVIEAMTRAAERIERLAVAVGGPREG
jgi:cell division protein ZapA